jgi:prephenate dehydratase
VSVAYQGVPGAFGHEACLRFLPSHRPVAKASFAEVAAAVESEETEFGILPVENNAAGPVEEARAVIAASPLAVIAEHVLPVRQHLLALPGVRIEEIKTIVSHPVALKQCGRALAELGVETKESANTALAAKNLTERHCAVLASEAAAEAYGLTILRRDLNDRPDNETRFAVLAREKK